MRLYLNKILEVLLSALLALMIIDVLWQVTSRYILSSPSSFTDELAGFMLVWLGLLGAAYEVGQNGHLAIDLLIQKVSDRHARVLKIIISSTIVLFALFVMCLGGTYLVYTRFILEVTSASLQINMGYVYLVMPLSGAISIYYSIDDIIHYIKKK